MVRAFGKRILFAPYEPLITMLIVSPAIWLMADMNVITTDHRCEALRVLHPVLVQVSGAGTQRFCYRHKHLCSSHILFFIPAFIFIFILFHSTASAPAACSLPPCVSGASPGCGSRQ